MLSDHAMIIGRMYGVGDPVDEMVLVARGEQGRVWRLDTHHGAFAIKELIIRQTPADASADAAYQEVVRATGAVPMPRPIRTPDDRVVVDLADYQLRAYEWVDVLTMDRSFDPDDGWCDDGGHSSRAVRSGAAAHWLVYRAGRSVAMEAAA